ncbi:hypothetical protein ASG49_14595 [Marmoricola sp. Leaf446]|uniref:hypothetical protein n=1 Tax=Marmoricola sp. Leaf446 TaxID=1736379 RepID=UPI0006F8384E|nr:hypothetical protein [Marmoricola sp. Leaf446]KQT90937.1 hypothetical protein ASG49_14595 [Marmoricola sp. Leaf446]
MTGAARLDLAGPERDLVEQLLELAPRGLARAVPDDTLDVAQTVRVTTGAAGVVARPEGRNLRYAAMAALGLARLAEEDQRRVLRGRTAADLVRRAVERAGQDPDPGAVALTVWAAAEVLGEEAAVLVARLRGWAREDRPLPAVDVAWMLTAATALHTRGLGDHVSEEVAERGSRVLLAERGAEGLYPHVLPASGQSRWRSHVGSFADQVYPLQALARGSAAYGHGDWLRAAETTAARLCHLQGPAGQWWWHYDSRDGGVVERFPVYSVHQHAMAPMVLHDLREAGGTDHTDSVVSGLSWLHTHPEVLDELVSPRWGLVWRKVGRREPPKAARALGALTTAVRPGLRVPGLDAALPPVRIDHECRPYELGWLLYAWLPEEIR